MYYLHNSQGPTTQTHFNQLTYLHGELLEVPSYQVTSLNQTSMQRDVKSCHENKGFKRLRLTARLESCRFL